MAAAEAIHEIAASDDARSTRLDWLRQRRDILTSKLAQKNNELKALCIEEAEITGVLPPELPLEPGESPPVIRKKSTGSTNQNLPNKHKTTLTPDISSLELECKVIKNKQDTALAILNDPSESKANKRKYRIIYQQSGIRLQELQTQLKFIKQSQDSISKSTQSIPSNLHGSQSLLQSSTKHRTKKPRPPLENTVKDVSPKFESRSFLHEAGVSLSPVQSNSEHNLNSAAGLAYPGYDFQASSSYHPTPSPSDHRRGLTLPSNTKYLEHDAAKNSNNNNVYVAPDNFRSRAYSQGGSVSPHQRLVMPNTYTEEERQQQMLIRQMKLKKLQQQQENEAAYMLSMHHDSNRFSLNEAAPAAHRKSSYHESDFAQDYPTTIPYHGASPKSGQPPPVLRDNKVGKSAVDTYVPPGYWMRLDDEIVWCTDEQHDRFGSLDRRKHQNHQNLLVQQHDNALRYHTSSTHVPTMTHHRPSYQMQSPTEMIQQTKAVPAPSSRMLMRTQSLGSVESPQDSSGPSTASNKLKLDKDWYESSAELPPPPPPIRRASQQQPPPTLKERAPPVRSNSIPANRRLTTDALELRVTKAAAPPPPREIPAESKLGLPDNGNPEPVIPLNSPTTNLQHTLVQPGKYQPYREVTKPFEMSDFYKYSTKFRKRVEANANANEPTTIILDNNTHPQLDQTHQRGLTHQQHHTTSYSSR